MRRPLRTLWLAAASLLVGFVWLPPVHAGGSADTRVGVDKFGAEAIRDFALRVNDELDRRKVNVAIVARCGRPRSELPRGIHYTHVAFIVFEPMRDATGQTFYSYATYNLYQGGAGQEDRSRLKQDVTYDFVAGMAEGDVAICVPIEPLQKRLLATLRSPAYRALHNPAYNVVANPWRDRFDNCVTHTLKVCVAAIYGTHDSDRIYGDIRAYFRPTPVHLSLIQSIGAAHLRGFSYEDQEPDGVQTATYDSLAGFLEENGLVTERFVVTLPAVPSR
jgi:hypothetical protein